MFLISKFKNNNLVEIVDNDLTKEDEAAVKLQKIARGFIVRRNLKINTNFEDDQRTVEEGDDEDIEDDIEDDDINNLYIISINNIPYFYESEFKVAQKKMLYMARQLNYKNNLEYNDSYIRENYEHPLRTNNISVIRKYSFLIFSYDYVLHDLRIDVVKPYNDSNF